MKYDWITLYCKTNVALQGANVAGDLAQSTLVSSPVDFLGVTVEAGYLLVRIGLGQDYSLHMWCQCVKEMLNEIYVTPCHPVGSAIPNQIEETCVASTQVEIVASIHINLTILGQS